ncbi:MAG: EAL domain-containing protein [Erythrobacter sp.]
MADSQPSAPKCNECRNPAPTRQQLAMAFQPILDLASGTIFAHEALVRGQDGASAHEVLAGIDERSRYAFDQQCRIIAIEEAARLALTDDGSCLSINFLPNAVYEPRACIRTTIETALRTGFPANRIIFEFTEDEQIDAAHLLNILRSYRAMGFQTAIDDFGAGYAGLALLSRFQPDIVKIDMELIRQIDSSPVKRTLLGGVLAILADLGITPVCEGIETIAEFTVLREMGVNLMQGFLFAEPCLGALAQPAWPAGFGLMRASA